MLRLSIVSCLCFLTLSIWAQDTSVFTILDKQSKQALSYVHIKFSVDDRGTISNEEGRFQLPSDINLQDTLVISHLGYTTRKIPVKETISDGYKIYLQHRGYQLPMVTIGKDNANKIIDELRKNIKRNHPSKEHLLTTFYNEKSYLTDGSIISYGEGQLNILKRKYQNKPSNPDRRTKERYERTELTKGFCEDLYIDLAPELEESIFFPLITGGLTMASKVDLLSSIYSPLQNKLMGHYEFSYNGIEFVDDKVCHKISFKARDTTGFYNGSMLIDQETYALRRVDFETTIDANYKFNAGNDFVDLLSRNYEVTYQQKAGKYVLGMMKVKSTFFHNFSKDTVFNELVMNITACKLKKFKKPDRNKSIYGEVSMLAIIPYLEEDYWKNDIIILRSKKVQSLISKRKITAQKIHEVRKEIGFIMDSKADVPQMALAQDKLIFIDIYADWCYPCKQMDRTTFQNQKVINTISENYVPWKIDYDKHKGHKVIRDNGIRGIPAYVIMTPFNQVISFRQGYMDEVRFYNMLEWPIKNIHVSTLDSIYNVQEDKKIAQFMVDYYLYKKLKNAGFSGNEYLIERNKKNIKDWTTPDMMDFIFSIVSLPENEDFQKRFFNRREAYKERYGHEAYYNKIYTLCANKDLQINKKNSFPKLIKKWAPEKADSLTTSWYVYYYQNISPDPTFHAKYILQKHLKYPVTDWEEAKHELMSALIDIESIGELNQFPKILDGYHTAPKYEILDILSVCYYKQGYKDKAVEAVTEMNHMASEEGIIYKSSLSRLRAEKKI